MELLSIDFLGKPLRLEASMAGWQQLFWNNQLVSQLDADSERGKDSVHEFKLLNGEDELHCKLEASLDWQPFLIEYRATLNDQLVEQGSRNSKDIERQVPFQPPVPERRFSFVGLVSLGFKALKSAKLIKVVLASASLAAYSWLFSFQFALSLLACLIFTSMGM